MPSRIDWYLVELERMLKWRVSDESLSDLLTETRGHLEALKASSTLPPEEAERKAIIDFGSPRKLAMKYWRDSRPVDWGVQWIVVAVAALVYLMPVYMFFEDQRGRLFFGFFGWFFVCGVFLLVSLWLKRFRPLPIVATVGALSVVVALFASFNLVVTNDPNSSGLLKKSEAKYFLAMHPGVVLDSRERQKLWAGVRAFSRAQPGTAAKTDFRANGGFLVPIKPTPERPRLAWAATATYEQARATWKGWPRLYFDREWETQRNLEVQALIRSAPEPGLVNFIPVMTIALQWAGLAAAILLGLQAVAAAIVSLTENVVLGRRTFA